MSTGRSSFAYRVAYAHARRVLRHYLKSKSYVGAVILPAGSDLSTWSVAVNDLMTHFKPDSRDRYFEQKTHTCDVRPEGKKPTIHPINTPTRIPYCYVVAQEGREEFLASKTAASLDFINEIAFEPSTFRHCVQSYSGQRLSVPELAKLAALTDDDRALIVRKGRTVQTLLNRFLEMKSVGSDEASKPVPAGPKLSELHGYGEAAEWGMELARDIADYREGRISWDDVDSGLLLSGPPGTGKTTFAAALARECGVSFVSGSFAKWQANGHLGDALKAMKDTFRSAREKAPAIVLIDEVDNFGDRESNKSDNDYMRAIVNAFLEELDGSDALTGVVVVGACNHPDRIDDAVKRAGRLDRHIAIDLPDAAARVQILYQHLRKDVSIAHLRLLVRQTEGMSGADLERVARDARRLARRERVPVAVKHVSRALPKLEDVPADYLRFTAVHEAGHAVVSVVLGCGKLRAVRVHHRRRAGEEVGGYCLIDYGPFCRNDRRFLEDRVCGMLGGMAAEHIVYGGHASGAFDDLRQATVQCVRMLRAFGMGEKMTSVMQSDDDVHRLLEGDPELRAEVDDILQTQTVRARRVLSENMQALNTVAGELEQSEQMLGTLVARIVEDAKRRHTKAMSV